MKRLLRDAKKYEIAAFPKGAAAKIVGSVHLGDTKLEAPLSGRVCAYYRVTVSEEHPDSARGGWQTLIEEEDSVNFEVTDETGRAFIAIAAARFVSNNDRTLVNGAFDPLSERERVFLEQRSELAALLKSGKKLRYLEAAIEPGEKVSVFGTASHEVDPKAARVGFREAPAMRLRIGGSPRKPIVISDIPSVH